MRHRFLSGGICLLMGRGRLPSGGWLRLGAVLALLSWSAALSAADPAVVRPPKVPQPKVPATASAKEIAFFERKIRPLLVQHCTKCHSAKSGKSKGGLFLDSREGWMAGGDSGPAIVPGAPRESLLLRAVRHVDPDLKMPPKRKLSEGEVRLLARWIARGAADPRGGEAKTEAPLRREIDLEEARKFWAFQPLDREGPPEVTHEDWIANDIDLYVRHQHEKRGLGVVPDADRRTLLRRVTFDICGLPPTPDAIRAFLDDSSPRAFERVVDRLLASDAYAERWGRHWLDIARYAESTGRTRNYPYLHAWRYRDYVIDAFRDDKPFDQFLIEQIAGDLLPASSDEQRNRQRIATGFLALGTKDLNERNAAQYSMDNVDEQIDTSSRAFLALTVSCARCHDHKFDPIPTADYYALAGIFRSTEMLVGLSARQGGKNKYKSDLLVQLSAGEGADGAADARAAAAAAHQKELSAAERELARASRRFKQLRKSKKRQQSKQQMRLARNRIKKLAQRVKSLEKSGGGFGLPMAVGVQEGENPADCRVLVRGDIRKPGLAVKRGFLQVVSFENPESVPRDESGRLQLARWMAHRDNPLTARVFVNRVWHHLFGQGLVRTVDNFGSTGERPSDPRLLDHLALNFIDEGWSVKKLVRRIVLSHSYRISSEFSEELFQKDPENRFIWRMNQRRLEVEAIRDAMLAVSGKLVRERPFGSPVMRLANAEIRSQDVFRNSGVSNVRSVYLPVVRSMIPEMFESFDFADPTTVTGRRDVTTVATQALFFMNSSFVQSQSRQAAARLLDLELNEEQRVHRLHELSLGRLASPAELQRALSYLEGYSSAGSANRQEAWTSLCQVLFASAEFRYLF